MVGGHKSAECLQSCGNASWLIPLGLSLPYIWRLLQCLRVFKDTGAKPQLFNALKYSTAFPVIILSALKYQVSSTSGRALGTSRYA